ncbi:MAG: carbohydrate ABC transporter permease [Thermomicrobium sp.]|nr:carbohydrate ABC transporter permease [Thermomicrobium sp.]MDW8007022.1 carbohydrate ABC transporter permease [Thermomicrobium sp.]MDW8060969.1 carbohydrate ABC transporter permease [Thermomicrobium sp.]
MAPRWRSSPTGPTLLGATVSYLVLGLWTLVVLFPLYWLAITAFKLPVHVNEGPTYLPFVDFQPSLHAWRYILIDLGNDTLRPYLNTVVVGATSSVLTLVLGAAATYGLSRFTYRVRVASVLVFLLLAVLAAAAVQLGVPWPLAVASGLGTFVLLRTVVLRKAGGPRLGNADIAFWMISQRMLPPVAIVIPIYMLFQQLRMLDTRTALVIAYVAANLPIAVWLLRDYFRTIPIELEESASIDGANRYQILWRIVLPLSLPGLVATFLFIFVLAWNEYLLALFLSSANAQTMPLLVAAQNATRGPQWWYMSVLILLMIGPVIALAIVLERYIARGLLLGAVRG